MATHGLVLFGHGARDVRWREPFERLAEKLEAVRATGDAAGPVTLAFLELMKPDLPTAVGGLVVQGCDVITVVPVFFGQGGHIRKDLPDAIERCRALHAGVEIRCAVAVGEDEAVLDAVAQYCLRQV
ncbi:cobalamin biosynthesis protein CbiX [Paraburkholderia panacisoli]|uniref:Cobalamin biosynthesis protein CbiX n=1 Tax=Paraburkholderia panacisoli TaxID=2603818 RepID=A0A5B0H662_9BURK|nr:CbiX/SirB N-terminal domain-containing protein [Paraburkholderia panacisoli]KAA1010594.1 cobalamin biosynthesis protein CbiX [Paraburkholderia panacisoli]